MIKRTQTMFNLIKTPKQSDSRSDCWDSVADFAKGSKYT